MAREGGRVDDNTMGVVHYRWTHYRRPHPSTTAVDATRNSVRGGHCQVIYKGDQWEWEVLESDEGEYYIRRRHMSGVWNSKVTGPFSRTDMLGILTVVADKLRPDLMGIDGEMICHVTAP